MKNDESICYELEIHIKEEEKDLLSGILGELGIDNFVYGSISCDVEAEYNPADPKHDYYSELVQNTPIIIYSEDKGYLESVQKSLEHIFQTINIPYNNETFIIRPIDDQNWKESWKASFKPIFIGKQFAILPPWENKEEYPQKHKIIIDPGMAFGTGQHETTRLCLETMLNYAIPDKVLDVGTGSGILAIAAKMLGARYVLANDLDPDCMRIARENATLNGSREIIFTNTAIENIVEKNFGLVIANIQSRPLKLIMPSIRDHSATNAIIILSGILVSEMEDFIEFLKEQNITFISSHIMGDWCSLVCKRP